MTRNIFRCDRCGFEKSNCDSRIDYQDWGYTKYVTGDLCPNCYKKYVNKVMILDKEFMEELEEKEVGKK